MPESRQHSFEVTSDYSGLRLDEFVARAVPNISRSRAKSLIGDGLVRVDGTAAKAAKKIKRGERIEVEIPAPAAPSAIPQDIPLDILYEDDDIIAVNKPAGMVAHPAAGHPSGTLVNALLHHCKNLSGIGGEMKPGIVHRLDIGTSGVMVVAKNDEAHKNISAQFKARTVAKVYLALVFGAMRTESGKFDTAIGRSARDRKRMSGHTKKGRAALTEWKVMERFGAAISWLQINLRTGRMHQIRVHFSESGHPLVGDSVYGGKGGLSRLPKSSLRDFISSFPRPALHAYHLEIDHPKTGKRMKFTAKVPGDIEQLLKICRGVR